MVRVIDVVCRFVLIIVNESWCVGMHVNYLLPDLVLFELDHVVMYVLRSVKHLRHVLGPASNAVICELSHVVTLQVVEGGESRFLTTNWRFPFILWNGITILIPCDVPLVEREKRLFFAFHSSTPLTCDFCVCQQSDVVVTAKRRLIEELAKCHRG